MSPAVPIGLLAVGLILLGCAIYLDLEGRMRPACVSMVTALLCLGALVAVVGHVNWDDDPYPAPTPAPTASPPPVYHPETCMDLAWLDGRWTCIPREQAG